MANPIFKKNNVKVKNVFTAKQAKLDFGTTGVTGVLVQGLNFTYAQNITRLYEIGSGDDPQNIYYVVGRTQGQMQVNRVVGPNKTITKMYEVFGDACRACDNPMTLSLGATEADNCCPVNEMKYFLKGCALQQVGISLQAQDMLINEQCQVIFSSMDYE